MNSLSFNEWMEWIDVVVITAISCSVWDLEDYLWRNLYDAGYSPEGAASIALEELGYT